MCSFYCVRLPTPCEPTVSHLGSTVYLCLDRTDEQTEVQIDRQTDRHKCSVYWNKSVCPPVIYIHFLFHTTRPSITFVLIFIQWVFCVTFPPPCSRSFFLSCTSFSCGREGNTTRTVLVKSLETHKGDLSRYRLGQKFRYIYICIPIQILSPCF